MTRQIDQMIVSIAVRRNADSTYTNELQGVQASFSDPNPVSGAAVDKGPFMINGVNGLSYDGAVQLSAFILSALQSVATRAGVALHTDRVLNRTTKQYLVGINGSLYDPASWVVNPDMAAVNGVPVKYWKINGDDTVSEMDQSEKDAADAAALPGNIVAKIKQMKLAVTTYIAQHYDPAQQITLLSLWADALSNSWPNRIAMIQSVMAWVDTVLAYFYGKVGAMSACTAQSELDAITYDFSSFNATDPNVSLGTLRATKN